MTTIAYKDGVLACDGRASMGTRILSDEMKKVFVVAGGNYKFEGEVVLAYGFAGDYAAQILFDKSFRYVDEEGDHVGLEVGVDFGTDNAFEALIVTDTSVYHVSREPDENLIGPLNGINLNNIPFAIGSGGTIALTLMRMGYTAEEAVKETINHDSASGGVVKCWKR